jgi:hypothetical protein
MHKHTWPLKLYISEEHGEQWILLLREQHNNGQRWELQALCCRLEGPVPHFTILGTHGPTLDLIEKKLAHGLLISAAAPCQALAACTAYSCQQVLGLRT